MDYILGLFLDLDTYLEAFVSQYGPWIYALLFLIIFCETGLVVTPFLPGDSLLFATGALAAAGFLDIWLVMALLIVAAILGDAVNYSIGHYVGPRVFRAEERNSFWQRALNRDHLMKAHDFFERYGGVSIVLGRFVPIVRTFVPFVAGAGTMSYPHFAFYNVSGAFLWIGVCAGAGYAFGNVPVVKDNFTLVVLGIIFVSVLPMAWHMAVSRRGRVAVPAEVAIEQQKGVE